MLLAASGFGATRSVRVLCNGQAAHVRLGAGSVDLFVKRTRHPAEIVARQMYAAGELARCDAELRLPESFGFLEDGGAVLEVWEWVEDCAAQPALGPSELRVFFSRFVAASNSLDCDCFPGWLDWTLMAFDEPGQARMRARIRSDDAQPEILRRLFRLAEEIAVTPAFRATYRCLPTAFVHTDIRSENFVGNRLVDFSNSRHDRRVIEFSRFLLLNVEAGDEFVQLALSPESLCSSGVRLTDAERNSFVHVVAIDVANLCLWAHQQITRRSPAARAFYKRSVEQAALVCDMVEPHM